MDQDPIAADAAHAMQTALRHNQRKGRFGRDVRSADEPTTDARTAMQTEAVRFERLDYEVDADAVAAAIVNRLLAGGALPPPR
jgi:hypothetical protein